MPDAGAWPDWIAACVAFAALVVAAVAARATLQTNRAQAEALKIQQSQIDELRSSQKRAQASRVTFWLAEDPYRLIMANFSDLPAFNCKVHWTTSRTREAIMHSAVLMPGFDARVESRALQWSESDSDFHDASPWALTFFDVTNTHWRLEYDGRLTEID